MLYVVACNCVRVKLRNPAMQSLVTNAKALKALQKIQQGVDMLHSEAPNLVSRSGLCSCLTSLMIDVPDVPC